MPPRPRSAARARRRRSGRRRGCRCERSVGAAAGREHRFDDVSLDPRANLLAIAHLDDDHVVFFDVRRRKVTATIAAPGVHGVLAVPELGRVFASATDAHELLTISERTDSVVARARAGDYPDGITWDPRERRAFVSDETGGAEIVVDARGRAVGRVEAVREAGAADHGAATVERRRTPTTSAIPPIPP